MKNTLLGKNVIELYDYTKLKSKVLEVFRLIEYIKIIDDNASIPKITADYRVRYNQFTSTNNSKLEDFVLKKLMIDVRKEEYRKKLLSKITLSLRKLNDIELEVFNLTFYEEKNEEDIMKTICYGKDKVRDIKKSATIKFLTSLGIDNLCFKRNAL